ncbi:MAG: transcriptional coactivator p15/PC4 family protein [Elusimicrobia bacterium]|nr:transcriptional coactivator p15/PC4 family protein [Candidatus Liberimonas magnetica]
MAFNDNSIFQSSKLITKLKKSALEELRISILKNNMVDFRIHMFFPNETEAKPTKKGAWVPFDNLSAIIEGFEEVLKDNDKPLSLEFDKPRSTEKLRVYVADFKNNRLVHIRTYFTKNGELVPGKGISFPIVMLKEVLDGIKEVMKQKP